MAERLIDFARPFIRDPSRQKELDVAVLLWETPTHGGGPGQTLDLALTQTSSGSGSRSPSDGPLVFPLRKGASLTNAFVMGITVGRTDNNDLVLNDASISRFHAYFIKDSRRKEIWKLVDAESKNGTWVGAMRLKPNAGVEVHDQARIRFGDVEMTYLSPESFFRYLEKLGQLPE